MTRRLRPVRASLLGLLALGAVPLSLSLAAHDRGRSYEITITNLTRAQILSPVVAVTHDDSVRLFEIGQPASPELARLAEDGDNGPLSALLECRSGVQDVVTGPDGIPPGASQTLTVRTRGRKDLLSLAGMLVSTNDTFAALDGIELQDGLRTLAIAYDAGSEVNNEDCAYIPGPPCGNGGVRDTVGAEGRVYVSNGIHGQGSLDAAEFDWDNPVLRVEIRRASRGGDDD